LSNRIICDLIIDILFRNGFPNENALPAPYYSAQKALNHCYGASDEKIDMSHFVGQSYHLASLIEILVRRNRRDLLNEVWKGVTNIYNSEFSPKEPWEYLTWYCKEGELSDFLFKRPQSWRELCDDAQDLNAGNVPRILANPFCYYFLICYPHRLNRYTSRLMSSFLKENSSDA
jgi:hypothetical protein